MTSIGRFWGSKIENFRFFFWVPNEFLYGLGVVWGLYKWILDITGEPCEVHEDRDAREAREADFSSTIRDLENFWFFGQNPRKSRFQIFVFGPQRVLYRFWMGPGAFLDIKWGVYVVFRGIGPLNG